MMAGDGIRVASASPMQIWRQKRSGVVTFAIAPLLRRERQIPIASDPTWL
jgi:hypothetical protein